MQNVIKFVDREQLATLDFSQTILDIAGSRKLHMGQFLAGTLIALEKAVSMAPEKDREYEVSYMIREMIAFMNGLDELL